MKATKPAPPLLDLPLGCPCFFPYGYAHTHQADRRLAACFRTLGLGCELAPWPVLNRAGECCRMLNVAEYDFALVIPLSAHVDTHNTRHMSIEWNE